MKICGSCNRTLPYEAFAKNKTKKDGLQNACKECNKKRCNEWYKDNKEVHYINARALLKDGKLRFYQFLLDKACIVCGESDPIVLEFDHREPNKKDIEISVMVTRGYSWSKILKEIEKCDILCCNCHRKRTAKQQGTYKFLFASVAQLVE